MDSTDLQVSIAFVEAIGFLTVTLSELKVDLEKEIFKFIKIYINKIINNKK
jgi:hypothetical protein